MAASIQVSTSDDASKGPQTSPINSQSRPQLRRMTSNGMVVGEAANNVKKEVANKARIAAARAPAPPSPMCSSKNLVQELAELGKLFKDGLLSEAEFKKAKKRLI